MKGGKICLRVKSEEDPACKGHEPGEVRVENGTLYVCAAKGPALTSVYKSYLLSAAKLSQDLLDFLVNVNVEDLTGIGPTSIFAFVQEHGCLSLADLRDAQEADTVGSKIPTMTPAKRKKDLESPNGTFSTLTDTGSLLKEEVSAMIAHVEALGAGSSIRSRAQEVEDSGNGDAVQVALEDLQTCVCDGRRILIYACGNCGRKLY